jgi:hypothetical protein
MTSSDGIQPCVGCDEAVDALYCSYSCMQDDDGRVLESPLTDDLYYVTEWEKKGDEEFVAHEKQRIDWSDDTGADQMEADRDE